MTPLKRCLPLAAAALAATPLAVHAQILDGSAVAIDGDSLEMTGNRIRLYGIDAPEGRQTCERNGASWACGEAAAAQLREIVGNRQVRCAGQATDRYGRTVAVCSADGRDLALAMIRSGLATVLPDASPEYHEAEAAVRGARYGIWGARFEIPAAWRAANRREEALPRQALASSPPRARPRDNRAYRNGFGCAIKGNRSYRGEWIYYLPGSKYYEETRPEDLFCTEEQAQAAGYRPSRAG